MKIIICYRHSQNTQSGPVTPGPGDEEIPATPIFLIFIFFLENRFPIYSVYI